jgi:hypothetical protein
MNYYDYYLCALLHAMKWVASFVFVASAVAFVLILCNFIFGFGWGDTWWAATFVLGLNAISFVVRRGAMKALQQMG